MLIDGIAGLGNNDCPVCVVGSGPVGLALAVALARKGIDVLVLESGGRGSEMAVQSLSDADIVDPRRHDDMAIAVARRLGGTSHLWGGRCLPYDPLDFSDRPAFGPDVQWPIGLGDISPYIPAAVDAMGSGDAIFTADTPLLPGADEAFLTDGLERWVNVQSSDAVFRQPIAYEPRLRIRTHATAVGIDQSGDGRVSHVEVAHSLTGERIRVPVRTLVLAAGGIETTRLLLATSARHGGDRFGAADGPLGRYYMGHLSGEIADVTLANGDLARKLDFYVDRHGSYVRRRIVAHEAVQREHGLLNAAFWPVVPPIADPRHCSAILSLLYLMLSNRRLGNLLVAEAIRRRHVPDHFRPSAAAHARNLLAGLPSAAKAGLSLLKKRYLSAERLPGFFILNGANRYGLAYHGEHLPNPDSRVVLTDGRDRLGMPRLRIDLRFSDADAWSLVTSHDLLEKWLLRNNVGSLDYRMDRTDRHAAILDTATHGTHQIGLTRIGENRQEAVVDADLRTFDASNLYIASASILRTSGHANPTLTTVAMALRLADLLEREVMHHG